MSKPYTLAHKRTIRERFHERHWVRDALGAGGENGQRFWGNRASSLEEISKIVNGEGCRREVRTAPAKHAGMSKDSLCGQSGSVVECHL